MAGARKGPGIGRHDEGSGRNELTTDKDAGRTIPYRVVVLLISASYGLETNSNPAVSIKS